jgi:tetratricopeptide (TPR) repeat protein
MRPRAAALLVLAVAGAFGGCRSTFVRRAHLCEHPAVVALYAEGAGKRKLVGSGFFVRPGVLVTAHHVVRRTAFEASGPATTPSLVAESVDGSRHRVVRVRGTSPSDDVAVIETEAADAYPAVPLRGDSPAVGEPVIVVGYVAGMRLEPGRVVTSPWVDDPEREGRFVATCNVAGGHSGGPLFDGDGRVVGVAVRGSGGSVVATTASRALPLLDERGLRDERAALDADMGGIEESLGNLQTALRRFQAAVSVAEADAVLADAVECECDCLQEMGKTQDAVDRLSRRVAGSPRCAWAERLLGEALLERGDPAGYEHLATAAVLDPENPEPVLVAAESAGHVLPAPDPRSSLRRVVERAPRRARAWELLGRIARREGDYEEAVRAWTSVATLKPDDAHAFGSLADAQYLSGRYEEARETAEAAVRRDPKSSPARSTLVLSLLALGEKDSARRALKELRAVDAAAAARLVARAPALGPR